jgi:small-conductance mechanosensitive channel
MAEPYLSERLGRKKANRLRERLWFVAKFFLLAGLLYLQSRVPDLHMRLGISARYIEAVLLLITVHLFFDFARIALTYLYLRRNHLPPHTRDNFTLGINQIASLGSSAGFLVALLLIFNIEVRQALTAITVVAAAIAILFKDYISNMLNGMILMFSSQFSLDDRVKIGAHKGIIVDITLLNVHLLTDDDEIVYIPNNVVLGSDATNFTRRAPDKYTVEFEIPYTHLRSIPDLEAWVKVSLAHFEQYIDPQTYSMKIAAVMKDAVSVKFQYRIRGECDRDLDRKIRKHILQRVIDYVEVN